MMEGTVLFTGTCDNLDCYGETYGDCKPSETPIRIYRDGDGRIGLQAKSIELVDGKFEWSDWHEDAVPFRFLWNDLVLDEFLVRRLVDAQLLER